MPKPSTVAASVPWPCNWAALCSVFEKTRNFLMKTAHDLVMQAKSSIREVSLDEAEQAIRDADLLLDVREADEFATAICPVLFWCRVAC
jgi:hypothetical protein